MRQRDLLFYAGLAGGLLVIIVIILFLVMTPKNQAPYGYKFLRNRADGYTVIYPNKWQYINTSFVPPAAPDQKMSAAFRYQDPLLKGDHFPFMPNANIVIQDLKNNPMDLKQYTEAAIHQVRMVFKEELEVVETSPEEFCGLEATKFVYRVMFPGKGFARLMSVWTVKNDKAYQFTFAVRDDQFENYQFEFERMIKSFKLVK